VLEAEGPFLAGPGIRDRARLTLPDPEAFRANHALFPLGFDAFLTCGNRVAGLPRSTRVEDF
ncbi:MAG: phosphonate C-P lyase system protein PhnH, partial [Rhodobacterales bacterium]